jgi:heterodisulfide reductase subunit A-like polyferredoxin
MILCVGPAEQFCGRICCTTALKNALALKRLNPDARVTILFKDIRTYGFKEKLYTEARRAGVLFVRYDADRRPSVVDQGGGLEIRLVDPSLGETLVLHPDLLVLSNPVVPAEGSRQLATMLKIPADADGFFLEAHVKLRPVDFNTDGLFMAGLAHYPKLLEESLVQARAAAARAARLLSRPSLTVGGVVAQVDASQCVGCLTCVRVCPFDIPRVDAGTVGVGGVIGAAYIEPTTCRGCGNCVAECPAKAIQLAHYRDDQIMVKLEALLAPAEAARA